MKKLYMEIFKDIQDIERSIFKVMVKFEDSVEEYASKETEPLHHTCLQSYDRLATRLICNFKDYLEILLKEGLVEDNRMEDI